jgi:hypothetical protein
MEPQTPPDKILGMRAAVALLFSALFVLWGCSGSPVYHPPAQFAMPLAPDPVTEVRLIKMNDPDATFSILDGVLDAGRGWGFKWTLDRARFQLIAGDLSTTDYFVRYSLDPTTFRDRGPVRIMTAINGETFDTFVASELGEHVHRRKADSLKSSEVRTLDLTLTVDPPWISSDGTKLGVFLDSIGFVARE